MSRKYDLLRWRIRLAKFHCDLPLYSLSDTRRSQNRDRR